MTDSVRVSTADILRFLDGAGITYQADGCRDITITGCSALSDPQRGSLTWSRSADVDFARLSTIGDLVLVAPEDVTGDIPTGIFVLAVKQPRTVLTLLAREFFEEKPSPTIHPSAVVETNAMGANVSIGALSYIGPDVTLGDRVRIADHVSIRGRVTIGDDTTVDSGAVIGAEGFGFVRHNGIHLHMPHFGGISIGERVFIGANSVIQQGALTDTIVGADSLLDCAISIGHGAQIGKGSIITTHAVLTGSAKIGDRVYIAPGSIVINHKYVGDDAFVGAASLVNKDVGAGEFVSGYPAKVLKGLPKPNPTA